MAEGENSYSAAKAQTGFFCCIKGARIGKMKTLIIDIRPLLPKHPPGGVPEYTRELLKAMFETIEAKKMPCRIILFSSGKEKPELQYFEKYRKACLHEHLFIYNQALNALFKFFQFPEIDSFIKRKYGIKGEKRLTVFAPNINLLPLSRNARLVATFHDLSFKRYPFFLKQKERLWHKSINPEAFARRANAIIAVSKSTKQDLVNLYHVDPKKIEVIYSGITDELKQRRPRAANYKLQTILYLGSLEGRKNVEALKRAFALVKGKLGDGNVKLVLAGPPHRPVSSQERIRLYKSASLFVYPSIFEGFGLPPLEAMRCGVPVITSQTSSLPEAVGDAALMVNPHRVHELAGAMEELLTDEKLRAHYIEKGYERAKQFTWQNTAKQTLNVLLETEN